MQSFFFDEFDLEGWKEGQGGLVACRQGGLTLPGLGCGKKQHAQHKKPARDDDHKTSKKSQRNERVTEIDG